MTMRPIPGTSIDIACESLRDVEYGATNVLGAGHTGDAIVYAYLQWALEAARTLRGRFIAADVDDLLLTKRYWHLQATGHVDLQLAPMLVEAEIKERVDVLRAEQSRLRTEEKRWARGRIIVLDTSALIHGRKAWEWDPAEDLELRDATVHLVVPILVMDELDGLKESTKQHTRHRARETLKWISEGLDTSPVARIREGGVDRSNGQVTRVRGDIYLEVLLDDPGHHRLPIADDEIVDRASSIAWLTGQQIILVTDDAGQAHRARISGLTVAMVVNPIYDVDVQEAARAEKQAKKEAQRQASRHRRQQPPAHDQAKPEGLRD